MSYFENIVGQNFAKELFTSAIESVQEGGDMLSVFMQGEPGLGKTEVGESYGRELAKARGAGFTMFHSPKEFRPEGAEWDKMLHFMKTLDPHVLFCDEVHEGGDTIRCQAFQTYLRKALDPRNNGKTFPVFSQSVVGGPAEEHHGTFDSKNKAVIIATNFTDKVDPSGALQSRLQLIELAQYNELELMEIQRRMFKAVGIKLDSTDSGAIMGMIARCGRGTARPITNITKRLRMLYKDRPISFAQALRAIRLCSYYPRGVTISEIKILTHCIGHTRSQNELLAMIPNSNVTHIRKSIAYLGTLDYLQFGKGIITTPTGAAFLKNLKDTGFIN